MRQGFGSALVRTALALLLAVALSAAGWAHRLPASYGSGGAALEVYLAAGGSVEDLCGTSGGTAASDEECPVCRMPGTLALPARIVPPAGLVVAVVAVDTSFEAMRGSDLHPPWYGRAPPVV
jgi:hypothetical protein